MIEIIKTHINAKRFEKMKQNKSNRISLGMSIMNLQFKIRLTGGKF